MRHFFRGLLISAALAVGLASSAHAQGGNTLALNYTGAPTGTRNYFQIAVDNTTGDFYTCDVSQSPTVWKKANLTGAPPVAVNQGGTGATTASGARTNLGTAASGANSDITSLSGLSTPLSVVQGGLGLAAGTSGGVPCYTASTTVASSAALAANGVMIGKGAGLCPATSVVTIDSSGNIVTAGNVQAGSGDTHAGGIDLVAGTAIASPALAASTIRLEAPAAVTAYTRFLPAAATGFYRGTLSGSTLTDATPSELSGDATTSGSNAVTVAKVNGVAFGSSPSNHQVPVITASNTETYKTVPDCTDSGGNHLNFTQSTDVFSCGTSSSGGGGGGTAGSPLFVQTAAASAVTSTTPTTVIGTGAGSLTIPAAWFTAAGTVLDVHATGKYSTGAVPGTQQLILSLGGTAVCQTSSFTPLGSVTNGSYSIWLRLVARTVGASGTIFCSDILSATGATLTPGETPFSNPTLGTAVTIDTTVTQVVDLQNTWGTGATNSITGYTFELVGPGSAVSSVNGSTGAVTTPKNLSNAIGSSDTVACSDSGATTGTGNAFATTYTIPANQFTTNTGVRIFVGYELTTSGSPPSMTTYLTLGGTAVYTSTSTTAVSSVTSVGGGQVFELQGTAAAGASVNVVTSPVTSGFAATTSTAPWGKNSISSTTALATNGTLAVLVRLKCASSTAGNSITVTQLKVFLDKP